jgi:hypothetical protein
MRADLRRVPAAVALAFSLFFLTLGLRDHFRRGAPARARTVMARSGHSPARAEASLLLLQHASRTLPPHATVTLINPANRERDLIMVLLAHGHLPRQRSLPPWSLDGAGELPQFVIAVDAPLQDARYHLVHETAAGGIWRRNE